MFFLMRRSAADVQLAVRCSGTLDSISGISGSARMQSFHIAVSEHLSQHRALLLKASPVTTKTTLWFLDGTDTLALADIYRMVGERFCSLEP